MIEAHFDLQTARDQARRLAEGRRAARRDFERYTRQAAEAERDYRLNKARAFAGARAEGEPAGASEIAANAASAEDRLRRDLAHSMAKSCEMRIAELEADRALLNRFCDWSMRLEALPA